MNKCKPNPLWNWPSKQWTLTSSHKRDKSLKTILELLILILKVSKILKEDKLNLWIWLDQLMPKMLKDSKEWSLEPQKEIVGTISKILSKKIMISLMEKHKTSKKKKWLSLSFSQVLEWNTLKIRLEELLTLLELTPLPCPIPNKDSTLKWTNYKSEFLIFKELLNKPKNWLKNLCNPIPKNYKVELALTYTLSNNMSTKRKTFISLWIS